MKKVKRNLDRYALGTGNTGVVRSYMPDPSEVLADNNINIAKAVREGMSNPWAIGLETTAAIVSQMGGSAIAGMNPDNSGTQQGMPGETLALGTSASGTRPEVEGGEMFQTPDGQFGEFTGPSHEQGGISADLPEGTKIFSDRLKIGKSTMAERKAAREALLDRVLKKSSKNPSDAILMNTLKRVEERNALQEEADLAVQEVANQADMMFDGEVQKLANGTGPRGFFTKGMDNTMYNDYLKNYALTNPSFDINNPQSRKDLQTSLGVSPDGIFGNDTFNALKSSYPMQPASSLNQSPMSGQSPSAKTLNSPVSVAARNPDSSSFDMSFMDNGMTTGDYVGMAGTAFGAIAPLLNTEASRASDTPNINPYEGFGEDALDANSDAMAMLAGQQEKNIQDVNFRAISNRRSNRNTARGVNVMRALDLTSDIQANEAIENIYSGFATQMASLYANRSQLENAQDSAVMAGEQYRDEADRRDKDNYYTNKAENLANISTALQKFGGDLNKNQSNQDFLDILPGTTANGIGMNKDSKGWYFIDANGNKEYVTIQKKQ